MKMNNSYDVAKKFNFTFKEKRIYELAQEFMLFNRNRGDFRKYLPDKKDPRESKYWVYFERLYDLLGKKDDFDMYIFLEALYRSEDKQKILYPQQLLSKNAIIKYKEHKENKQQLNVNSTTEVIMLNLTNTKKIINRWWRKNNKNKEDYESFFAPKENDFLSDGMVYCIQGKISKYFMSISKTFNKYYMLLDNDVKSEIITANELKKCRLDVKLDQYAWSFAKEIYGKEVL